MLVSTVPGTMAAIHPRVSRSGEAMAAGEACTSGAAASFHPPESDQSPSPAGCSMVFAGGGGATSGLLKGALGWGSMAGSCGATLPANWMVWIGHGLEPASKVMSRKSGSRRGLLRDLCAGECAAMQSEQGNFAAEMRAQQPAASLIDRREFEVRAYRSAVQRVMRGLRAIDEKANGSVRVGRGEEVPVARFAFVIGTGRHSAGQHALRAEPQREATVCQHEEARILIGGQPDAADGHVCRAAGGDVDPGAERPGRCRIEQRILFRQRLDEAEAATQEVAAIAAVVLRQQMQTGRMRVGNEGHERLRSGLHR